MGRIFTLDKLFKKPMAYFRKQTKKPKRKKKEKKFLNEKDFLGREGDRLVMML